MKALKTQEHVSFGWKVAVAVTLTIVVVTVGEGGVGAAFEIQLLATADVNGKQTSGVCLAVGGFDKNVYL
jgi:hypothetical protein